MQAGVVDQDVDRAELATDPAREVQDGLRRGDVAGQADRPPAGGLDRPDGLGGVQDVDAGDRCAIGGEALREGGAQTPRGARDHRDLAL